MKVLEGDEGSVDTCQLGSLRVIGGEREGNSWVVDNLSGIDVLQDFLDEISLRRWACAGNLDGGSICSFDGTVAVTSSSGVATGSEAEAGNEGRFVVGWGCFRGSLGSGLRSSLLRGCFLRSGLLWGSLLGSSGLGSELTRCRLGVDGGLLGDESGGGRRASNTRAVEVLESDQGSVNARLLSTLRAVSGERDSNSGVVDSVTSGNVCVQRSNEGCARRWASAWDQDGLSVGSIDTIAVAVTVGVDTGSTTKLGNQIFGNTAFDGDGGDRGDESSGIEGGRELHGRFKLKGEKRRA